MTRPKGFERPILALVVDRAACALPVADAVTAAVRGGVDWVQLRERSLDGAALLDFARRLQDAAAKAADRDAITWIVNRRADVALALPAAGVHLGFDAMAPEEARKLLGDTAWIGVSAHDPAEVLQAAKSGADYAHLAPIYAPLSKTSARQPLGPTSLQATSTAGIAVLAQGGVEPQHCASLLRAGAKGVAVTGSILMSKDPQRAAASFRDALDRPASAR